jgi:hypothetical protein
MNADAALAGSTAIRTVALGVVGPWNCGRSRTRQQSAAAPAASIMPGLPNCRRASLKCQRSHHQTRLRRLPAPMIPCTWNVSGASYLMFGVSLIQSKHARQEAGRLVGPRQERLVSNITEMLAELGGFGATGMRDIEHELAGRNDLRPTRIGARSNGDGTSRG